jgi:outer membrane protein TolC
MKFLSLIFLSLAFGFAESYSQKILSADEAIKIALKNNYDIQLSKISLETAKANNTEGAAGMLPTADLNAGASYGFSSSLQEKDGGAKIEYPSASALSINASVVLNWTLYDGGKMYVTKHKLEEIQALGELSYKAMINNSIYQTLSGYYAIVKLLAQMESIKEIINYNTEREKIASVAFSSGSTAETDYLQAKIDLNNALQSEIMQKLAIEDAKKNLKTILAYDEDFEVETNIPDIQSIDKISVAEKIDSSNINIQALKKQIRIAKLALEEAESASMPKISLNASMSLSQKLYANAANVQDRTLGPTIGANFQMPLYTAGETDRKIAVAKLQNESTEIELLNLKNELKNELTMTLKTIESQSRLLSIENDSYESSKKYLDLCLQRLQFGKSSSLESHLAQEQYANSAFKLINYRYNLKIAEIKIKQILSEL